MLAPAKESDEAASDLPLERRYRKWLVSDVADVNNLGGEFAGAIIGDLCLEEFPGTTPCAHIDIDIAGTAHASTNERWRPKGATGYGARLVIDLALNIAKGDGVMGSSGDEVTGNGRLSSSFLL